MDSRQDVDRFAPAPILLELNTASSVPLRCDPNRPSPSDVSRDGPSGEDVTSVNGTPYWEYMAAPTVLTRAVRHGDAIHDDEISTSCRRITNRSNAG